MKKLYVGMPVIYVDHYGQSHAALATAVWGPEDFNPEMDTTCINVVFVDGDEEKTDTWGRQIGRDSSVVHKNAQTAHGNYWDFPE